MGLGLGLGCELPPGVEVLAVLEELASHGLQHKLARRLKWLIFLVPLLRAVLALLPTLHPGLPPDLLLGLRTGLRTPASFGLRRGGASDRALIS